jgi:glycosyltransferase involved in cell wall biosynthesis
MTGAALASSKARRRSAPVARVDGARYGIDAHALSERLTGTSTYVARLVEAMERVAPDAEVALYRHTDDGATLPYPTRWVAPGPLWTSARLPLHFARHGAPAAMLFPSHTLPLWCPARSAVTVHDLAFEIFPDHFTTRDRLRLKAVTRHAAARADVLLADSRSTGADLVERLGVDPARVRVVHLGVDREHFRPAPPHRVRAVRARHGLERPYVLAVGTLQRRKNHAGLVRAARILRDRGVDFDLAFSGGEGWLFEATRRLVRDLRMEDRVRFLGYAPTEDLPALYTGASASALVSLYEGFGLPVLEALACGSPMLVSDVSSLPEVGGDAVLTVDPRSDEAIADALERLLGDSAVRAALAARAPAHLARFSWERTARETLDVLSELA